MEFHPEIKTREDALKAINYMIDDYTDGNNALSDFEKSEIYNSAIWTLQELAENKKIEYKGYFRTKYEKHSEFETILGPGGHQEHINKRELYVFMSAQDDEEIFEILLYVLAVTKSLALNKNLLAEFVFEINAQGTKFQRN